MWCPSDYTHIHEVLEKCEEAAWLACPRKSGAEFVYIDEEKTMIDHSRSQSSKRYYFENMIRETFFRNYRYQAFACSSAGVALRLSPHVVRPVLFNHTFEIGLPFTDRPEMLYIDERSGKIDTSDVARKLAWWDCQTRKSLYERHGLTAEAENVKFDPAEWSAWQEHSENDFGELKGWSVCYPMNEINIDPGYLLEAFRERERRFYAEPTSQTQEAKPGRPRVIDNVARIYWDLYPTGHPGTWKEALRQVIERFGSNVSLDTLQRGVRQSTSDTRE